MTLADNADLIVMVKAALYLPAHPRFFETERGYQGRFYYALQRQLDTLPPPSSGAILELEYQKSSRHGTDQRPDIVYHVPAVSGGPVDQGNLLVVAMKRRASPTDAIADFEKLDEMCDRLKYGLGCFINVDDKRHHGEAYSGPNSAQIHAFAVRTEQGRTVVEQWPAQTSK